MNVMENDMFRPEIKYVFCVKDLAEDIIEVMGGHCETKDLKIRLKVDGGSSLMVRSDQNRIE